MPDIRAQAIELLASSEYARVMQTLIAAGDLVPAWADQTDAVRESWRKSFGHNGTALAEAGWRPPTDEPEAIGVPEAVAIDTETRPRLADVIAEAIAFGRRAGMELDDIGPDDFALQRSPGGYSHATYLGEDCVIAAVIAPDGSSSTGAGDITWIYADDLEGDFTPTYRGRPLVDVHLPGDGPKAVAADA